MVSALMTRVTVFSSCGDRAPVLQDSPCVGSSRHYPFILLSSEVPRGVAYTSTQSASKGLFVPEIPQTLAQGPSHWGMCPVVLPALCICRVEETFAIQELDQETDPGSVQSGSLWI